MSSGRQQPPVRPDEAVEGQVLRARHMAGGEGRRAAPALRRGSARPSARRRPSAASDASAADTASKSRTMSFRSAAAKCARARLRLAALQREARPPSRPAGRRRARARRSRRRPSASTRRAARRTARRRHRRRWCRCRRGRARRPPRRTPPRPAACAAGRSSGRRWRRCRRCTAPGMCPARNSALASRFWAGRYQEASTTFRPGAPSRSFSHSGETRRSLMRALRRRAGCGGSAGPSSRSW